MATQEQHHQTPVEEPSTSQTPEYHQPQPGMSVLQSLQEFIVRAAAERSNSEDIRQSPAA